MSKKHFIALANWVIALKRGPNALNEQQIDGLANFCQSQNSDFKKGRWLAYIDGRCGPNGGDVPTTPEQEESDE